MKNKYEDPEMNVTRFEYEEIMTTVSGVGIDDVWSEGGDGPDFGDDI